MNVIYKTVSVFPAYAGMSRPPGLALQVALVFPAYAGMSPS